MPKIISIEGNIGAGKSTIIEKLKETFKYDDTIIFLKEPIDVWETMVDNNYENILQKFYNEPSKYAFSFQVLAFISRITLLRNTIKENPNCNIIICERSLDADRYVFAKMLNHEGLIEDINYNIYMCFYKEYIHDFEIGGYIYINADPDICYDRICKRNRLGEDKVSLEYLIKCQHFYNDWLNNIPNKVLNINANNNINYKNDDEYVEWLKNIEDYIINIKTNNEYTLHDKIINNIFTYIADFITF